MTEEAKAIMEFLQASSEHARQIGIIFLGMIGAMIKILFSMSRKVDNNDTNLKVIQNDVTHIKGSIEELKNK